MNPDLANDTSEEQVVTVAETKHNQSRSDARKEEATKSQKARDNSN